MSARCPVQSRLAGVGVVLEDEALDELATWAGKVKAAAAHAPGAEVWLSETGNAQCGGAPGVSGGFAGSFWWLGQLSERRQQQVTRQTLSGPDYGPLLPALDGLDDAVFPALNLGFVYPDAGCP